MNIKDRAKQLKVDIPAIFLCMKSNEAPISARILAFLTIAYALSPIDLIPDFIPVLGYVDDIIILPCLIAFTISRIPKDVLEHYRKEAHSMWLDGKPKKWYYALFVISIWLLIILLLYCIICLS